MTTAYPRLASSSTTPVPYAREALAPGEYRTTGILPRLVSTGAPS
nr:hypothetical protein [Microbispora cellulosiformans]